MKAAYRQYEAKLQDFRERGIYKNERVLLTPQTSRIDTSEARQLINMCANNYLGLADDARVIAAAEASYRSWGYGLSSVRFICGTQAVHKELEAALAAFFGFDAAILYSSCFDANGGLFESLLGEEDAVISDALNHASIIDGIRLCRAKRYRYINNDMADLERCLQEAERAGSKIKMIATDGVFSMDGIIANLQGICALAERYDALLMVDDSHASGFVGTSGRGTPEYCGVQGRVDILTSTLGKAMGGASGGFTCASQSVVDLLRQTSRPYLFSNTLAPSIASASLQVLKILSDSTALRDKLEKNTAYFREALSGLGLDIIPGSHPIVPVMLYDAILAGKVAARLLELGVYVIAFSYPVVPEGKARIRTQVSAAHEQEELERVVDCFRMVKEEFSF